MSGRILLNLVEDIRENNFSLSEILRCQHVYHEQRRWSASEILRSHKSSNFDEHDRAALWHASRAELTTQPAGLRLATQGVRMGQELAEKNPLGAMVLHAASAWSARYWLEEEAHHEVAYGALLEMSGLPPILHDEIVEHRGFFPEDNYARVCILQACVEIEAIVTYGEVSRVSRNPLVKEVFHRIMCDEVQHRAYFISFARGLVDAGVYPPKDVLAMAYTWIRPKGGETFGSTREKQTQHKGFVNWWERVRKEGDDPLALSDGQIRSNRLQRMKEESIFKAVEHATGIKVYSVNELQRAYFHALATQNNSANRQKFECQIV